MSKLLTLLLCAPIAACWHDSNHDVARPPLGESSAQGPIDPTVSPPDAPSGAPSEVGSPNSPAMIVHPPGSSRIAEREILDAGVLVPDGGQ